MGRSPSRLALLLIPLVSACFALSPMLQAQGQNTHLGDGALLSNTTGDQNTAIGFRAMHDNRAGSENTAIGYRALISNTNNPGGAIDFGNTAIGADALADNTTGGSNVAIGVQALLFNETGDHNVAIGVQALHKTTGDHNIAIGDRAGKNITTGNNNIFIGSGDGCTDANAIRIGKPGTQTARLHRRDLGARVSGAQVYVTNT